ncbi:MAG: hypothetical protein J1D87_10705 [Lachnospiraceae bacterium]|nr:hypothetical protein [Lachnospiraceae bacterium]
MVYMGKQKFIEDVAAAAKEDWLERHICLPSITIALAIEGSRWGKRKETLLLNELFPHRHDGCMERHESFPAAIRSHNNYLETWQEKYQAAPNWKEFIGQNNYILAIQYLQDAECPYCRSEDFDSEIVGIIEAYGLDEYDKDD